MPHFKAPDESLHFLDDVSFAHLLPAGCVEIGEAEADAIREAQRPPEPPTIEPIDKLRAFLAANPDVAAIL